MKKTLCHAAGLLGAAAAVILALTACTSTPANSTPGPSTAVTTALPVTSPAPSPEVPLARDLSAHDAVKAMGMGINIGNTLDNTTAWETGWGQPLVTRELIHSIAVSGFKTVRLPVAWDTYADDGQIKPRMLARVAEIAGWVIDEGMFCVINIHWDGGWINSGNPEKFAPEDMRTFSPVAQHKFETYWNQIATYFKDWNERLILEGLNEESDFSNTDDPFITLAGVNQLFIDTVRKTGGNNTRRILVIAGYVTDFSKTTDGWYVLPVDREKDRLMLSVHYYTPSLFTLLNKDASWGRMRESWGNRSDLLELEDYFHRMTVYSRENNIPVFVGEYTVVEGKESSQRVKWISEVTKKCLESGFVPVLWDTGGDLKRRKPYGISKDLQAVMEIIRPMLAE